jgi:ketosteroid isomerase-like protein
MRFLGNRTAVTAAFLIVGTGLTACGSPPAANKAAADEVTGAWTKAFDSGDAKALAALYTDDARSSPPESGRISGRDGIEAYWRDDIGTGGVATKLIPADSVEQGDLLHIEGSYEVSAKGGAALAKGQYQQLWTRAGGQWKVQHEIWRLDPTLQRDSDTADHLESLWTAAYNAGDASRLGTLYHQDAVLSTRPTGSLVGRDAIAAFWKDDFGDGKPSTKLELVDVYMAGGLAHLEGEYEVSDKGKVTRGHYVQLWMQDDGVWRIHREMWWQ